MAFIFVPHRWLVLFNPPVSLQSLMDAPGSGKTCVLSGFSVSWTDLPSEWLSECLHFTRSAVRGGAVPKRLQSVRVGGRTLEFVEGQQRGPETELWWRRPDKESQVIIYSLYFKPVTALTDLMFLLFKADKFLIFHPLKKIIILRCKNIF